MTDRHRLQALAIASPLVTATMLGRAASDATRPAAAVPTPVDRPSRPNQGATRLRGWCMAVLFCAAAGVATAGGLGASGDAAGPGRLPPLLSQTGLYSDARRLIVIRTIALTCRGTRSGPTAPRLQPAPHTR